MKKRILIIVSIIIVIALIAVIGWFIYEKVNQSQREYQIAKVNEYNYFVLKQNEKSGVIDKTGKVVINSKYDDVKIPNPERDIFACYEGNNVIILNNKGEELFTNYDEVEPLKLKNIASDLMYEKSVLRYIKDGKSGIIDFDGKEITKPIYDSLDTLSYKEGELLVKENNKYGVINIKGKSLVDSKYDQISVDGYYTEENQYKYAGYIVSTTTEEGYRYGYVDVNGKEIIKPEYTNLARIIDIKDNNNKYFILAKNGQFGLNKNGKNIINNEYQSIVYENSNSTLVLQKGQKYGAANLDGKIIVPVDYNSVQVNGIYVYADKDDNATVYDNQGNKEEIDSDTLVYNTNNENYKIKVENGLYSVVDGNEKTVIEPKYSYIEYLHDNYFIVSLDGKIGVIDDKSNEVLKTQYDSVQKVQGTNVVQAIISKTKTIEIYSNKLENVCKMENATIEIKDNYIEVSNSSEKKYFSKDTGKEMKNTEVFTGNKLFAQSQNDKWGFVDESGKVVVNYDYDAVTEFSKYGYAGIKQNGKWGVIDSKGEVILKPKYTIKNESNLSFIGDYYQVEYGFGEVYYTNENNI